MEEYYDRSSFRSHSESKHWGRKKQPHRSGDWSGQATYWVMLRSNGEQTELAPLPSRWRGSWFILHTEM